MTPRPWNLKRFFDVAVVLTTLPITLPVAVATAATIAIIDGRPTTFRQERLGLDARPFTIVKFRTMRNPTHAEEGDVDRVTALGRVLRILSLDELPQLINVLRGEMSLVGPRPLPTLYEPYFLPRERVRHAVRPGITGLAQVSGRNTASWEERLELDAIYVDQQSFWLDLTILVRTVAQVLRRQGVQAVPAENNARRLDVYRSFPRDAHFYLRPLSQEDLGLRVRWLNDPTVREHMSINGRIDDASTARWFDAHSRSNQKHNFALIEQVSGDVVAMSGVSDAPGSTAVLYFLTSPDRRGEGIGHVTVALTLGWCFAHRGYSTVRSSVSRSNEASLRIHRRFGFSVVEQTGERVELSLSARTWELSAC